MQSFEDILPLIFGIAIAIILFFGLVSAIKKSFRVPAQHHRIESTMQLREQKWRMDDVRQRQKQLLRDQRQKMRDMRR